MRDVTIPALDGVELRATLFEPERRPNATVIVSGATAVPRGYYSGIAAYLARCGATVVTYDYRGSGEPPEQLRRSEARMRDWGERDAPGVIAWLRARYPDLPVNLVGHSYGGHALLLAQNNHEVSRAVTIASGLGYWGTCARSQRYRVYALMKFIVPMGILLFGYSPGSRMGFGEDLAPGVAREWRTWVLRRRYFLDDPTLASLRNGANYRGRLLMLAPSDDLWITLGDVEGLATAFTGTNPEVRAIDPHAYGVRAIAHMGFFRSANSAVWRIVSDALDLQGERDGDSAQLHVHVD
ncbi:MAG TPA: alpha/beta fold hydrolase [Candidatus Acidoferrum sp.]|nr:alpha/beta fold hydrolase [Candidatus Acidoferrum sp.]